MDPPGIRPRVRRHVSGRLYPQVPGRGSRADLGTDWIGKRVYYPKIEDVTAGAKAPLGRSTYWVNLWRYPTKGGFFNYTHKLAEGARIQYGKKLVSINFKKRLWDSKTERARVSKRWCRPCRCRC